MARNRSSLPPYLEIRRGAFYWRRRLPKSLRDPGNPAPEGADAGFHTVSKKMFLCFSLRTHVPADAKILARRLTEMSDLVFAAGAETVMTIAADIQAMMLETLARFEIEAFERARAVAGPRSPELADHELRREEALQATLRQAIYLGDREVARQPLRHVAARLGIGLDESDPDWIALAYEATRTLLDVSQERARRQQGIYAQPSAHFHRAVTMTEPVAATPRTVLADTGTAPAMFATNAAPLAPAAPGFASLHPVGPVAAAMNVVPAGSDLVETQIAPRPAMASSPIPAGSERAAPLTPAIMPAGLDLPPGYDEDSWQKARVAARPPRILVDQTLLSDGSRAALAKPRGITVSKAIELYFDLLGRGYKAPFSRHQKRRKTPENLKNATIEARLCEDHKGKRRLALDYWPSVLGDEPVDEIHVDDVNDALERLWGLPANHGKSANDRGKYNLVELIEKADALEAQADRDIEAARTRGAGADEIDRLRLKGRVARLSVTTYVKHGRVMRAVGDMLMDMQLIDQNPFSICVWSNRDLDELRSTDGERKRQARDDRIDALFGSSVFQEPLDDIGEPLFWAPLIARHQGMRMEEILQLGPEDFGSDKGIPYHHPEGPARGHSVPEGRTCLAFRAGGGLAMARGLVMKAPCHAGMHPALPMRPNAQIPCHSARSRPANETGAQIHGSNLHARSLHLPRMNACPCR